MAQPSSRSRVVFRILFLSLLVWGILFVYQKYEIVTTSPEENGLLGPYKPGEMILVDEQPGEIQNADIVVFHFPDAFPDAEIRPARVIARPGDRIEMTPLGIEVNGTRALSPLSKVKEGYVTMPELVRFKKQLGFDEYLLVNDNLQSARPDSQRLGIIMRDQIWGVVVRPWPW